MHRQDKSPVHSVALRNDVIKAPSPGNALVCYPEALVDPVIREVIFFGLSLSPFAALLQSLITVIFCYTAKDVLWPSFCASSYSLRPYGGYPTTIGEGWFRRMLEVPIMRYALVVGTFVDLEYMTGRQCGVAILRIVNDLSREIRLRLPSPLLEQSPDDADPTNRGGRDGKTGTVDVDDDLLFAVMHLAKANSRQVSNPYLPKFSYSIIGTFGLFTPPYALQALQSLNLWGLSCPHESHKHPDGPWNASHFTILEHLVHIKGGIRSVKVPGFQESLHLFDVIESAKRLSRPRFGLPEHSIEFQHRLKELKKDMTARFLDFDSLEIILEPDSPLPEIFKDARIVYIWASATLGPYIRYHPAGSEPGLPSAYLPCTEDIVTVRKHIEHRLLSYSPRPDSLAETLAHTAALLFMHGVLLPIPAQVPMTKLIQRLEKALKSNTGVQFQTHLLDLGGKEFLLWVLTIGVMATSDIHSQQRAFLLGQLGVLAAKIGISSWMEFKKILERYLWVDWGCDAGGLAIWKMLSMPVIDDMVGPV